MPEKFDSKPVEEYEERLKREAVDRDLKDTTYLDLTRIDAYEAKRLRERTIEEIEKFDINREGLVVHGTYHSNLEMIIKKGLGWRRDERYGDDDLHNVEVDIHVIGAKIINEEDNDLNSTTKIGFRDNETVFWKSNGVYKLPIYLISDIFKNLYPQVIDEILKGTAGRAQFPSYEQIAIPGKAQEPTHAYTRDEMQDFYEMDNPRGFMVYPSDTSAFFVKLPAENDQAELLARKLLSFQSFNGIVIPEECKIAGITMKQAEILKQTIEIQDQLLPKEEQMPCYSTDGKCIYNPLKNLQEKEKSSE